MFEAGVYVERRRRLAEQVESGLILLLGNGESPMNYPDNTYPFRQDSSFLYFFGLDRPGLVGTIDADDGRACLFGDDGTFDDVIWTGPTPSLQPQGEAVGVDRVAPSRKLADVLQEAAKLGRAVHFLPQYRAAAVVHLQSLLGLSADGVRELVSEELTRGVIAQRSIKSTAEIEQIEIALETTARMHLTAMQMVRPGEREATVAGAMEGVAVSAGVRLSFPTIFSVRGEILHNHGHDNVMEAGRLVVSDAGAESPMHYAGDITRTIPVSGSFSDRQKAVYEIVEAAHDQAIEAMRPGVEFRDVHALAARVIASGLKDLGLMRGDVDEAVAASGHTLFFPHGLGHMMGLDVHDMEGLGEDWVGYTDTIRRRNQFGWRSLRLGKALEPGFVVTVEPGLYFIGELIDRWKAKRKCGAFIDYAALESFRGFGGVRIENDVLVTADGAQVLGPPIPKTPEEVEAAMVS